MDGPSLPSVLLEDSSSMLLASSVRSGARNPVVAEVDYEPSTSLRQGDDFVSSRPKMFSGRLEDYDLSGSPENEAAQDDLDPTATNGASSEAAMASPGHSLTLSDDSPSSTMRPVDSGGLGSPLDLPSHSEQGFNDRSRHATAFRPMNLAGADDSWGVSETSTDHEAGDDDDALEDAPALPVFRTTSPIDPPEEPRAASTLAHDEAGTRAAEEMEPPPATHTVEHSDHLAVVVDAAAATGTGGVRTAPRAFAVVWNRPVDDEEEDSTKRHNEAAAESGQAESMPPSPLRPEALFNTLLANDGPVMVEDLGFSESSTSTDTPDCASPPRVHAVPMHPTTGQRALRQHSLLLPRPRFETADPAAPRSSMRSPPLRVPRSKVVTTTSHLHSEPEHKQPRHQQPPSQPSRTAKPLQASPYNAHRSTSRTKAKRKQSRTSSAPKASHPPVRRRRTASPLRAKQRRAQATRHRRLRNKLTAATAASAPRPSGPVEAMAGAAVAAPLSSSAVGMAGECRTHTDRDHQHGHGLRIAHNTESDHGLALRRGDTTSLASPSVTSLSDIAAADAHILFASPAAPVRSAHDRPHLQGACVGPSSMGAASPLQYDGFDSTIDEETDDEHDDDDEAVQQQQQFVPGRHANEEAVVASVLASVSATIAEEEDEEEDTNDDDDDTTNNDYDDGTDEDDVALASMQGVAQVSDDRMDPVIDLLSLAADQAQAPPSPNDQHEPAVVQGDHNPAPRRARSRVRTRAAAKRRPVKVGRATAKASRAVSKASRASRARKATTGAASVKQPLRAGERRQGTPASHAKRSTTKHKQRPRSSSSSSSSAAAAASRRRLEALATPRRHMDMQIPSKNQIKQPPTQQQRPRTAPQPSPQHHTPRTTTATTATGVRSSTRALHESPSAVEVALAMGSPLARRHAPRSPHRTAATRPTGRTLAWESASPRINPATAKPAHTRAAANTTASPPDAALSPAQLRHQPVLGRRDDVRLAVRARMLLASERAKRATPRRSHPFLHKKDQRKHASATRKATKTHQHQHQADAGATPPMHTHQQHRHTHHPPTNPTPPPETAMPSTTLTAAAAAARAKNSTAAATAREASEAYEQQHAAWAADEEDDVLSLAVW